MVEVDTSGWSGEGTFTGTLLESLKAVPGIAFLRVEDAPATRSDADYNFISNEVFVGFATRSRSERYRRFGLLPATRAVAEKALTMAALEEALSGMPAVGPADYSDDTMLQYLRTERIIPPYQTRGFKLVEMVRIYEVEVHAAAGAATAPRRELVR